MIAFAVGGSVELDPSALSWAAGLMCLFFALSFVFSGTETAFFSLQKVDRQRLRRGGSTDKQTASLLDQRAGLITTVLIGNETVNIGLAALGTAVVAMMELPAVLNVLLLTPALVLFSEITPKVLAFRFNRSWAWVITWPLTVLFYVLWPVRIAVTGIVRLVSRLFRVTDAPQDERLQEEEILDIIEESAAKGDVDSREREIIEAVFEFDDLTVGRVMTPRPAMFSVPLNIGWSRLLRNCREAGFSRVPVYRRRPDDILGVLLLKDLLGYRSAPPNTPRELQSLLIPPVFVPLSKPADDMLREFLQQKSHMAFVVDEHGTLVGVVTLDDLLAELLDHETEEDQEIRRIKPGTLAVRAWMDVDDFTEETGIELPAGDYNTVGGFVFHALGRLPVPGDEATAAGYRFIVGSMEGRRISLLTVEAAPNNEEEQAS